MPLYPTLALSPRRLSAMAAVLLAPALWPALAHAQSSPAEASAVPAESSSTPESVLPEAPGLPQDAAPAPAAAPAVPQAPARRGVETSLSLGVFADLTATRLESIGSNGSFLVQSAIPVAGVAWSVRQSFTDWLGYSVNMSFARTSMHTNRGGSFGGAAYSSNYYTPVDQYELSLSYVARKHITPKLTGFTEVGAGMETFLPQDRGPKPLSTPYYLMSPVTFRPLGVLGLGVDYHFNPHWALRAEYRGLIFKYPDFGGTTGKNITSSSQPTVSITYTFGGKSKPGGKKFF